MKNKIYYLGLFCCILITVGCLFKIMHWPDAGWLLTIGMLFISLIFIPLALIDNYKKATNKSAKWLYILTGIILAINFISALFKIMNWPYAGVLFVVALPLPFVVLLPAFLVYYKNDKEINYSNFMAIIFFFAYFAAISALLSLKPSKSIIDSYEEQALNFSKKSVLYDNSFNTSKNTEIENKAKKVTQEIVKVKSLIISEASSRLDYRLMPKSENIFHSKQLENFIFLQVDQLKPLRNSLLEYKNTLKQIAKKDGIIYSKLDSILDTGDSENLEWEKKMVNGKIVIAALNELNMLEYQVDFCKEIVLEELK